MALAPIERAWRRELLAILFVKLLVLWALMHVFAREPNPEPVAARWADRIADPGAVTTPPAAKKEPR